MSVVKVSELKNGLSHYLRLVRRGESVLVSDRNRVIARIDPATWLRRGPMTSDGWTISNDAESSGALLESFRGAGSDAGPKSKQTWSVR